MSKSAPSVNSTSAEPFGSDSAPSVNSTSAEPFGSDSGSEYLPTSSRRKQKKTSNKIAAAFSVVSSHYRTDNSLGARQPVLRSVKTSPRKPLVQNSRGVIVRIVQKIAIISSIPRHETSIRQAENASNCPENCNHLVHPSSRNKHQTSRKCECRRLASRGIRVEMRRGRG
ncbi:hypothetical protein QE152_g26109 [Popillia japonica]|uniref:Uncharacterized protein n=1 Tax=Popillia japonica TaxID=7064 RepID=A0AAW1JXU4_POPJA